MTTRTRLVEAAAVLSYLALMAGLYAHCATVKMRWFDELFTLHLARAPQDLWANLRAGVDLHPPVSYLATWLSVRLFGETELALRLPAILGGVTALAATYLAARRRGPLEAFVAMSLVGAVTPVGLYFFEARSYGLTIGLVGVAAYCRQARLRLPFAAAVGLGMATHYYFAAAVVAFGLAEAARIIETRRLDWGMMAGLGVSLVVVAALAPLWTEGPREYKAGFWGKRPLDRGAVEAAYTRLADRAIVPALVLAFAAAFVARRRPPAGVDAPEASDGPTPISDAVAFAGLALAPVVGVVIASKVVGGGDGRYTLFALLGIAPVLARALAALCGGHPAALTLAALAFTVNAALEFGNRMPAQYRAEEAAVRRLAERIDAMKPPLPGVVVGSEVDAAKLWHYRLARTPVYYLADPEAALRLGGVDTAERAFQALGRIADTPCLDTPELLRRVRAGELRYYVGPPVPAAAPWVSRFPASAAGESPAWYELTRDAPEGGR